MATATKAPAKKAPAKKAAAKRAPAKKATAKKAAAKTEFSFKDTADKAINVYLGLIGKTVDSLQDNLDSARKENEKRVKSFEKRGVALRKDINKRFDEFERTAAADNTYPADCQGCAGRPVMRQRFRNSRLSPRRRCGTDVSIRCGSWRSSMSIRNGTFRLRRTAG